MSESFQANTHSMRKQLPLLAICLGYFMVILDATIVNVALPALGRDLGGGVSGLQWVIDAYTVVFAGLLLPAGSLGDGLGARRVFTAGLAVFTLASAACGAASSAAVLIAVRAVQGLGAALLVPSSLALLRGVYSSRHERARAVGVWGAVAGSGSRVRADSRWRARRRDRLARCVHRQRAGRGPRARAGREAPAGVRRENRGRL